MPRIRTSAQAIPGHPGRLVGPATVGQGGERLPRFGRETDSPRAALQYSTSHY